MLRRLLIVLVVLLCPLLALPSGAATPILVVYPFAVNGSAPADLGAQVSARIAAEITSLGGIKVVLGAASAKPSDYRSAAQAAGADMYLGGSLLPVGTSFSAISQLVSTRSGIVQWSEMFQFHSVDDTAGEGARVHDMLIRAAATPAPNAAASGVELITPPPVSGFAILPMGGSAIDGDRAYATRALSDTLQQRGYKVSTVSGSATIDPAANSVALCTTTGAQTLITGALDTSRVPTAGDATGGQTTAHIALQLYDCRTHAFAGQATVVNHIAPIANDAIRGAIEDAVSAFPAPS